MHTPMPCTLPWPCPDKLRKRHAILGTAEDNARLALADENADADDGDDGDDGDANGGNANEDV